MDEQQTSRQQQRRVATLRAHLASDADSNSSGSVPSSTSESSSARSARSLSQHETAGLQAGGDAMASYDYVVVGAGSAGCVVASRLSEDPKISVLLLEAGGSNQEFRVRSPMITNPGLQNSDMDWAYRTTPQEHTAGRVSHWPRGKTLGGCSSINYSLYVRGDPRNFDQWAERHGCAGWGYADMLPWFKKSENLCCSPDMRASGQHHEASHGFNGPMEVTDGWDSMYDEVATRETTRRFVEACNESGIRGPHDYNGPEQEGASFTQFNVKDGTRNDTASAFLFKNGALQRPNLTVMTHAHATKVVFQGTRATGVAYKSGDLPAAALGGRPVAMRLVNAKKEVVLCLGAVATPQLLMLSGVGPRAHLEELGIPVVADLPGVGEGLQDHLMSPLTYALKPHANFFAPTLLNVGRELANYMVRSKGTLMVPMVTGTAFFRTGVREEADGNDVQIHVLPYLGTDREQMGQNLGYDMSAPRFEEELQPDAGVVLLASLVRPFSTGRVRLRTADPFDHPLVDPCYLEDERDMEMLVKCSREIRRIAETTEAFEGYLDGWHTNPYSAHDPESDAYLEECIREEVVTIYHPTSTCKMGRVDDPMVVVDPASLEIKGLQGIRIADASVMPEIISGNTNAPTIAIGERCADFIRNGPIVA